MIYSHPKAFFHLWNMWRKSKRRYPLSLFDENKISHTGANSSSHPERNLDREFVEEQLFFYAKIKIRMSIGLKTAISKIICRDLKAERRFDVLQFRYSHNCPNSADKVFVKSWNSNETQLFRISNLETVNIPVEFYCTIEPMGN